MTKYEPIISGKEIIVTILIIGFVGLIYFQTSLSPNMKCNKICENHNSTFIERKDDYCFCQNYEGVNVHFLRFPLNDTGVNK